MGFGTNSYAKIKQVNYEDNGNRVVSLWTSRKDKDRDYQADFVGNFVKFVGKAKEKPLSDGDFIKILSCIVQNAYVDDNDKLRFYKSPQYIVFDFEPLRNDNGDNNSKAPINGGTEDDLPF